MQLLTNSRMQAFKTCRKQHWYAYEQGIRREVDSKALRMGSAYHAGLEAMAKGDDGPQAVTQHYSQWEAEDGGYEEETVLELVNCYAWRWENEPLEYVDKEREFCIDLRNPEGGKSTVFQLAGKIDGIVVLADGRLAVIEHKLLGDDIGPDSELWRRMRLDPQVSLYVIAARELGYAVDTVLYDVARKPVIKPTAIPELDENGDKIVLNSLGNRVLTTQKKPRQTASAEHGYVLQTRPMTREEWGSKLQGDVMYKPDWYFRRQEIPRLDADLLEYLYEVWDVQKTLRDSQKNDRWYRTVSRHTCQWCSYFELCENSGVDLDRLPEGFVKVENVHQELEHAAVTAT